MSILKGIKVDDFDNVTVIVFKDISTRHGKFGDNVHIVVSEADKSQSEEMVKLNETESLCWSDTVHNIDVILDFPSKKSIEQLIDYLTKVKEEMYN